MRSTVTFTLLDSSQTSKAPAKKKSSRQPLTEIHKSCIFRSEESFHLVGGHENLLPGLGESEDVGLQFNVYACVEIIIISLSKQRIINYDVILY
jgi:hypothetical protein